MGRRGQQQRQSYGRSSCESNANTALIGTTVSVVQKQDQGTGRLTSGVVDEILTNSAFHPRGIKVRLRDGTVGRISTGQDSYDFDNWEQEHQHAAPSLADFMVPLPSSQQRQQHAAPSLADFMVPSQEQPQPSSTEEEWACPTCTFINSGLLPECELCQTDKQ